MAHDDGYHIGATEGAPPLEVIDRPARSQRRSSGLVGPRWTRLLLISRDDASATVDGNLIKSHQRSGQGRAG